MLRCVILMVVTMKFIVLWNVTSCICYSGTNILEEAPATFWYL
jgi:hypothetical protein